MGMKQHCYSAVSFCRQKGHGLVSQPYAPYLLKCQPLEKYWAHMKPLFFTMHKIMVAEE